MKVELIQPKEWAKISMLAHKIVFDEIVPEKSEKIDFALMCSDNGSPAAFVTCREVDSESLYWAYGGALPSIKDTVKSWKAYESMTQFCKDKKYQRIFTLVENTNIVMIKFALKLGYKIIGTKNYKNTVLLELVLELGG